MPTLLITEYQIAQLFAHEQEATVSRKICPIFLQCAIEFCQLTCRIMQLSTQSVSVTNLHNIYAHL